MAEVTDGAERAQESDAEEFHRMRLLLQVWLGRVAAAWLITAVLASIFSGIEHGVLDAPPRPDVVEQVEEVAAAAAEASASSEQKAATKEKSWWESNLFLPNVDKVRAAADVSWTLLGFETLVLVVLGMGWIAAPLVSSSSARRAADEFRIAAMEQRMASGSRQAPGDSWDLARVKLESYLNRNLDQVRLIFWLACLVMLVGFGLIGAGIAALYRDPDGGLTTGAISAVSGVLVDFIGASLMAVYRSTMAQAQRYMRILERINAVGMSVQILDAVQDDTGLKNRALVNVSTQLLQMYGHVDADLLSGEPSETDQQLAAIETDPANAPDVTVG